MYHLFTNASWIDLLLKLNYFLLELVLPRSVYMLKAPKLPYNIKLGAAIVVLYISYSYSIKSSGNLYYIDVGTLVKYLNIALRNLFIY